MLLKPHSISNPKILLCFWKNHPSEVGSPFPPSSKPLFLFLSPLYMQRRPATWTNPSWHFQVFQAATAAPPSLRLPQPPPSPSAPPWFFSVVGGAFAAPRWWRRQLGRLGQMGPGFQVPCPHAVGHGNTPQRATRQKASFSAMEPQTTWPRNTMIFWGENGGNKINRWCYYGSRDFEVEINQ